MLFSEIIRDGCEVTGEGERMNPEAKVVSHCSTRSMTSRESQSVAGSTSKDNLYNSIVNRFHVK